MKIFVWRHQDGLNPQGKKFLATSLLIRIWLRLHRLFIPFMLTNQMWFFHWRNAWSIRNFGIDCATIEWLNIETCTGLIFGSWPYPWRFQMRPRTLRLSQNDISIAGSLHFCDDTMVKIIFLCEMVGKSRFLNKNECS